MPVSESTAAFLEAAAHDLERQLRGSGHVRNIRTVEMFGDVTLVASVRVGRTIAELTGTGTNLVAAYGDLLRHVAEPMLAATYREVLSA